MSGESETYTWGSAAEHRSFDAWICRALAAVVP
jgi:hypothetical protein